MSRHSRPRRIAAGLAVAVALTTTAAACSDRDDGAARDAKAAQVSAEACAAYVGLGTAFAGDPSQAGPAFETFETTAPTALTAEARKVASTFRSLSEDGGDPSALSTPAYTNASTAIADAYVEGCDTAAVLDVDGVDYGFEGLPGHVKAGRVAIRFTNATEHDEAHELVLVRRNDGVTESVDELLALPQDEAMSKVQTKGVVMAAKPGTEATTMVDLEPGSYIAVCFVPIGGAEDGAPHFTSGMVAELDVS